jgi:tetratricopeptide (TPR) repeat protein
MDASFVNFYALLGIDQSAADDQIKTAVKAKRALWYPKQTNPDRDKEREAQDQMKRIRDAEKALLNPELRAAHDKAIAAYVPPAPEPQPTGPADQRDWLAEAAKYLRDNQPEAAAYAAREATQLNGANPEAWVLRGRASLLLNQADSAVFECGEAVRLQPASAEYHGDLGSAYQVKRNYDRAIDCYRTAQQLAPSDRRYPLSIGSLYVLEDKPKEAIKVLEPLHTSQPDDQAANYWLAYALGDDSFYSWTPVGSDGSRLITTHEQVTTTKRNTERALALTFDDAELRAELNRFLGEANKAERSAFRFPGRKVAQSGGAGGCLMLVVYVIALGILFGVLSSYPIVGIVLIPLAIYGFYKLAVKPRWKRNADDLRAVNAATGGRGINA